MNTMYGSKQAKSRPKIASIKPRIAALDTRVGSSPATERIRGREHDRIRERILVRDGVACVKCGKGVGRLEVDHIIPLFKGGPEADSNRQLLCESCHRAKTEQEEKERGYNG